MSLLAGFTGAIAFAARAFETYAFPTRPDWLPNGVAAAGMVLVAALLHGVKVQTGALAQNIVVFLKVALLIGFLAFAATVAHVAGHRSGSAAGDAVLDQPCSPGSLVWISLSYSGFNAAVYVAGEAKDAQRNAPKALWVGTLIVTVLYIALNAAFVYLPPFEAVAGREDVAAAAAQSIGGAPLALAIRFVTVLALITSVFSLVMAGPRVYARMADDGVFPRIFRFGGGGAPTAAILAQAALAIALIALSDLRGLLSYLGFTLSVSAALTVASLFVIARREGRAAVNGVGLPVHARVLRAGHADSGGDRRPPRAGASCWPPSSRSSAAPWCTFAFGLHRARRRAPAR